MATIRDSDSNNVEGHVLERYARAADQVEQELCCPVEYPTNLLKIVPEEIRAKDYGCGDPTPYARPGDTVLDLGSGGGKLCYMLAQVVGKTGRVIGVDANPPMLSLARKYQTDVSAKLGYENVEFRYGLIQDLRLDLDLLHRELAEHPVRNAADWLGLREVENRLRSDSPLIEDATIDCVVSNCVLNLVRTDDRLRLFSEIYRVLRNGGRAAISDIVADEDVPSHLREDPQLWSGCISGAFREDQFLQAFEDAGFHGLTIAKRDSEPWQTIEGIEFRSMTVVAYKGKEGPSLDRNQAVVYRGPFRQVSDDDNHVFHRGARTAVCEKTFRLLQTTPYDGLFDTIEPRQEVPLSAAAPMDRRSGTVRHPRESKGESYDATTSAGDSCCGSDEPCR